MRLSMVTLDVLQELQIGPCPGAHIPHTSSPSSSRVPVALMRLLASRFAIIGADKLLAQSLWVRGGADIADLGERSGRGSHAELLALVQLILPMPCWLTFVAWDRMLARD